MQERTLTFSVFGDPGQPRVGVLGQAYLFGGVEGPVSGEVEPDGSGGVVCRKKQPGAAGVCLPVYVGAPPDTDEPPGMLALPTCLLPPRDEPYLLTLELTRRRIMGLLNKLEDWGMFELPPDDPLMVRLEKARGLFTEALVFQRKSGGEYCADADAKAGQALALSVDVGEMLAVRSAADQSAGRLSGQIYRDASEAAGNNSEGLGNGVVRAANGEGIVLPGTAQVGCAVNPGRFSDAAAAALADACDFVAIPMRWVDMEPQEGQYSFAGTDRWIEWAVRTGKLPVVAGPVIDLRRGWVPDWLHIWENDYETLRELVYEHVRQVVTRYRRTVSRWTIVSGLNLSDNFAFSPEQALDLTRIGALVVRKLHPQARVQVEVAQPWGEYQASGKRTLPPRLYAELIRQTGISVDAIGIRIQMGRPERGWAVRDLLSISELLDSYAELERPLSITAVGVPSAPPEDSGDMDPGWWRGPFSPELQARWLDEVVRICAAKPYVRSVCWQELQDGETMLEMPAGGLVDAAGVPKPALAALKKIRDELRPGRNRARDL